MDIGADSWLGVIYHSVLMLGTGFRWLFFIGTKPWKQLKQSTTFNFLLGLILIVSPLFLFPTQCKQFALYLINLYLNRE